MTLGNNNHYSTLKKRTIQIISLLFTRHTVQVTRRDDRDALSF